MCPLRKLLLLLSTAGAVSAGARRDRGPAGLPAAGPLAHLPLPSSCPLAVEVGCTFLFGAPCIACAKASAVIGTFCNATALRAACATSVSSTHSTAALSQPRRNIGAVSYEGTAYFAGGCVTEGPAVEFVCDNASAVVDVFAVAVDGGITARPRLRLSAARGWVAAGAAGGYVVFAGGGTLGSAPHSRRADVLEVAAGSMVAVVEALSVGRWGIGVASATDAASSGPAVFFTGGKVTIQGYDNAFMTAAVDVFRPPAGFARAPYRTAWTTQQDR